MTPGAPIGANPAATGLPGAGGSPSGSGTATGADFLAIFAQLLGDHPAGPGGQPATVPVTASVAGSPATPASGASAVPAAAPVTGSALPLATGEPDPQEDASSQEVADGRLPATPDAAILAALGLPLLAPVVVPTAPASTVTEAPDANRAGGVEAPAAATTASGAPSPTPTRDAARPAPVGSDEPPASTSTPTPTTAVAGAPTPATPPAEASPAAAGLAAVTGATPAAAPSGTGSTEPTPPAPVTQQVFPEVVKAARAAPNRVVVRLQPESLGEVRVVLSVRDGALRVSLAATGQAHHTLLEGAPELRRLLEAAGSPDARVVVRDLPATAATATTPPAAGSGPDTTTGQWESGQWSAGQGGAGQPGEGAGQTPERRARPRPGSSQDLDPADPPRRTESVTRTRTAGVDVTM